MQFKSYKTCDHRITPLTIKNIKLQEKSNFGHNWPKIVSSYCTYNHSNAFYGYILKVSIMILRHSCTFYNTSSEKQKLIFSIIIDTIIETECVLPYLRHSTST